MNEPETLPELKLEALYTLIGNQTVHINRLTAALQAALLNKEALEKDK
jgi:hypothetical protein